VGPLATSARQADAAGELVARPRPFGAKDVTREIRERYGARLDRKIDSRTIVAKLRRLARAGKIHLAREGRALYEALYTKSAAGV
jgi:hypothetical protein